MGRKGGYLSNLCPAFHRSRHILDRGSECIYSFVDSSLDRHWIGSRSDVFKAFMNYCLGKNSCSCCIVSSNIICFASSLFQKLGSHVFKWILKLYLFCNSNSIAAYLRRAEFLVKYNVSSPWAQCNAYCVRHGIYSTLHGISGFFTESKLFSHYFLLPFIYKSLNG